MIKVLEEEIGHITENQQQDLTRISQGRGNTDDDRRFRQVYISVKNKLSRTDKECFI